MLNSRGKPLLKTRPTAYGNFIGMDRVLSFRYHLSANTTISLNGIFWISYKKTYNFKPTIEPWLLAECLVLPDCEAVGCSARCRRGTNGLWGDCAVVSALTARLAAAQPRNNIAAERLSLLLRLPVPSVPANSEPPLRHFFPRDLFRKRSPRNQISRADPRHRRAVEPVLNGLRSALRSGAADSPNRATLLGQALRHRADRIRFQIL